MNSFRITASAHQDCTACIDCAGWAEGTARVTGSVGGTHTRGEHSATVTRLPVSRTELKGIAEDATRTRLNWEQDVENAQHAVERLELQLANAKAALAEVAFERDEAMKAEDAAHQAAADFEVAEHERYLAAND